MEIVKKPVKLGVLVDPTFQIAWNALTAAELPIKISFQLAKIGETLMSLQKQFEAQRVKLVEKYAEKSEEGKPVIDGEQYKIKDRIAFDAEFFELLSVTEELPTLDHTVLGDEVKLTAQQISVLLQAILR